MNRFEEIKQKSTVNDWRWSASSVGKNTKHQYVTGRTVDRLQREQFGSILVDAPPQAVSSSHA
jgi:hypothetical protein